MEFVLHASDVGQRQATFVRRYCSCTECISHSLCTSLYQRGYELPIYVMAYAITQSFSSVDFLHHPSHEHNGQSKSGVAFVNPFVLHKMVSCVRHGLPVSALDCTQWSVDVRLHNAFGLPKTISQRRMWAFSIVRNLHTSVCQHWMCRNNIVCSLYTEVFHCRMWPGSIVRNQHTLVCKFWPIASRISQDLHVWRDIYASYKKRQKMECDFNRILHA